MILILIINCSSSFADEKNEIIKKEIPVRKISVYPKEYTKNINGTGEVISAKQVNLMFEVAGKIEKVYYKVGQLVNKGEIIAKLKNEVYKAKYKLAETALNKAKRDLKNIEILFKKNAVSEDQFLEVQLGEKNANANFISAKYAYESTYLSAPFSGTITHINLIEEELFSPGPMLLAPVIISKMDQLQIKANISSKDILNLKNGQLTKIFNPISNSQESFLAKISEVGYVPTTMSKSYTIKMNILNKVENLKLGSIMNFSVSTSEIDSVYMISNRFILKEKNNHFIWAISENKPKKIYVKINDLVNHEMIIEGELYPGIDIITDGSRQIDHESKLRVVK